MVERRPPAWATQPRDKDQTGLRPACPTGSAPGPVVGAIGEQVNEQSDFSGHSNGPILGAVSIGQAWGPSTGPANEPTTLVENRRLPGSWSWAGGWEQPGGQGRPSSALTVTVTLTKSQGTRVPPAISLARGLRHLTYRKTGRVSHPHHRKLSAEVTSQQGQPGMKRIQLSQVQL